MRIREKIQKLALKFLVLSMVLGMLPVSPVEAATAPSVSYSAHVEDNGWLGTVSNGKSAGTTGYGYRTEAIKISLKNATGNIKYSVHVQNQGWSAWAKNGAIAGTTGQSLRIEAIKIKLTGTVSEKYDVYYRTHIQNQGWGSWVKNGVISGTVGNSLRMEAFQIELVKKGASPTNKEDNGQTPGVLPVTKSFGQQVADYACQFVGNPYVWGGTSLTNGCDCSGFVMSVYAHFGISLPHSSVSQRSCGYEVSESNRQPGDIICYSSSGGNSHVGIYIGHNQVVNAGSTSTGICIRTYNYRAICNIRRIK